MLLTWSPSDSVWSHPQHSSAASTAHATHRFLYFLLFFFFLYFQPPGLVGTRTGRTDRTGSRREARWLDQEKRSKLLAAQLPCSTATGPQHTQSVPILLWLTHKEVQIWKWNWVAREPKHPRSREQSKRYRLTAGLGAEVKTPKGWKGCFDLENTAQLFDGNAKLWMASSHHAVPSSHFLQVLNFFPLTFPP